MCLTALPKLVGLAALLALCIGLTGCSNNADVAAKASGGNQELSDRDNSGMTANGRQSSEGGEKQHLSAAGDQTPLSDTGKTGQASKNKQGGERDSHTVQLISADSTKLKQWIVAQKENETDLVLVDLWATWCGPCVKKYPKVVELYNKHKAQGLAVVAVSMDEQSQSEAVKEFIVDQKAEFAQMIALAQPSEAFEDFELDSVPTYRLYRTTGELIEEYDGEFEFDDIVAKIEEVLNTDSN